jgi:hypothetical protein
MNCKRLINPIYTKTYILLFIFYLLKNQLTFFEWEDKIRLWFAEEGIAEILSVKEYYIMKDYALCECWFSIFWIFYISIYKDPGAAGPVY